MYASSKQQTDLTDTALQNLDLALFIDGLSCYLHGQCWTRYSVIQSWTTADGNEHTRGRAGSLNTWSTSEKRKTSQHLYRLTVYLQGMACNRYVMKRVGGGFISSGKSVANGEEAEPVYSTAINPSTNHWKSNLTCHFSTYKWRSF